MCCVRNFVRARKKFFFEVEGEEFHEGVVRFLEGGDGREDKKMGVKS